MDGGYSANSGVRLLAVDGYAFKDLNRNGLLDPYEDWRLTPEERAVDLAGQLSTEEIAGLMLYSAHQSIPGASKGFGASTYNGKSFDESGAQPSDLSDAQRKFLTEDNVRHVLVTVSQPIIVPILAMVRLRIQSIILVAEDRSPYGPVL